MMENLFHVTLNALFILKIFLSWLLSLEEKRLDRRLWMMANLSIIKNGLIRKIRLISQLMTKNCNAHIVQYLKKYQGIKFGLLTKYNMTNSFLYTQIVVEKLFSDLFLKIQNWLYLWINSLNSLKIKRRYEILFFPHFLHGYKKYFPCYILLPEQI